MIWRDRNLFGLLVVGMIVAASVGIVSADCVTATLGTGKGPSAAAVNPVTNKIYVQTGVATVLQL